MKILHVVFSTNRLKYLTQSLDSWKNLDFGDHSVDRLLIDDYPRTRNDSILEAISKVHNAELLLNKENKGLSVVWSEFWDRLKTSDYDYVFHQEDDVVFKKKIFIDDLLEILKTNPEACSVVLERQPWYSWDEPLGLKPTDEALFIKERQYWYAKNEKTFPIISSFYSTKLAFEPIREYWGWTLNEGMIMVYLNWKYKYYSITLKDQNGQNIIEHIGEVFTGRRILENEPRWEIFKQYDPDKNYCSRTGNLIET